MRFEARDEARSAARHLIEYCSKGRAWVFTDIGTTASGESLYGFTHQTFLEYFTAEHLLREFYTPHSLWKKLEPKVTAKEWDMVAQLAVQLQCSRIRSADDMLFNAILKKAARAKLASQWNLLSFSARSLGYLVPRPAVTRMIVEACIVLSLKVGLEWNGVMPHADHRARIPQLTGLIDDLVSCNPENRPYVGDTMERLLVENLTMSDDNSALNCLELVSILDHSVNGLIATSLQSYWSALQRRILNLARERLVALARENTFAGLIAVRYQMVSLADFINWHWPEGVFKGHYFRYLPEVGLFSVAEQLAGTLFHCTAGLQQIGAKTLESSFPIATGIRIPINPPTLSTGLDVSHLSSNARFGLLCLMAMISEGEPSGHWKNHHLAKPHGIYVNTVLGARTASALSPNVKRALQNLGLVPEQRELIQAWIHGEISFLTGNPRQDNYYIESSDQEAESNNGIDHWW